MCKKYSDNICLNDGTVLTMTVDGDFGKLFEVLGVEVHKKEDDLEELKNACETVTEAIKTINRIITETVSAQTGEAEAPENKDPENAELEEACNVVERHNYCFTSPTEFCCARACKECEYYQDDEVIHKAVNHLLDHTKKSLKDGEKANNRYARNVTGGVELYDYAGNYVGYVHGFMVSEEGETDIRSIVQNSWGLLTFNPHTLEKIIEDHGYISDFQFLVELYKNPSDIKLPEQWYLMKRKAKEGSK